MPDRTRIRIPKYRLHKPTGLAVVRLSGRDIYLGLRSTAILRTEHLFCARRAWRTPPDRPGSSVETGRGSVFLVLFSNPSNPVRSGFEGRSISR